MVLYLSIFIPLALVALGTFVALRLRMQKIGFSANLIDITDNSDNLALTAVATDKPKKDANSADNFTKFPQNAPKSENLPANESFAGATLDINESFAGATLDIKNKEESISGHKDSIEVFLKTVALIVGIMFFLRVMWHPSFLRGMSQLRISGLPNQPLNLVTVLLNWFTCVAALLAALAPFFRIRAINYLAALFVLPVAVLNIVFCRANLDAMLGAGYGFDIRIIYFALEQAGMLTISVCYVLRTNFGAFKTNKLLVFQLLGIIVLCLIAVMPDYTLKALFGMGPQIPFKKFKLMHRILLYVAIIIPLSLFVSFRHKDLGIRRFICLFVCLGGLSVYVQSVPLTNTFADITIMPLHLCNTAMYILPLCVILNTKRLFYFTLFINVAGAFVAILLPSYAETGYLFDPVYISYWYNHYIAFFMPFVLVSLGIFPRARLKQFFYAVSAFCVYFVFMVFINSWFVNYRASVDYFFLNSDYIASQLGVWAQNLYHPSVSFTIGELTFVLRPLYQGCIFAALVVLCAGLWFIYENTYDISAAWIGLFNRNKRVRAAQKEFWTNTGAKRSGLKVKTFWAGIVSSVATQQKTREKGMKNASLKVENFGKIYNGAKNYAVRGVNLEVNGGEIFGFLGPNGAGKSTLIKSIVGIQPLSEGSISICGYDCERQSVEAKRHVGFVPDNYALYDNLTGREYVNYIADLYRVPKDVRNERIKKLTEELYIADKFDRMIKTFSHGMKQKTAIIAALVHQPVVWVLDEPLTGLDPDSIYAVKQTMQNHIAAGNIVFFSSHIIDVVENLCDRIAIIKSGKIAAVEVLKDLKQRGIRLEQYYKEIVGDAGIDTRETNDN